MNKNNVNNNDELNDTIIDYRADLKEMIISKALLIPQKDLSESYFDIFRILFLMPKTTFSMASFSIFLTILISFLFGFISNSNFSYKNSRSDLEDIYYSNGELL